MFLDLPLRTEKQARPEMSGHPCPSEKWSKGQLLLLKSALGDRFLGEAPPSQLVWVPAPPCSQSPQWGILGSGTEALSAGLPGGPFPWLHQPLPSKQSGPGRGGPQDPGLGERLEDPQVQLPTGTYPALLVPGYHSTLPWAAGWLFLWNLSWVPQAAEQVPRGKK